jgi:Asp-tRNA(Asn)/Glu-tRNA(Gln) amidotransferase C subunit
MPKKWPDRVQPNAKRVRELATAARLDLSEKRAANLVAQIDMVHAMADGLGQVELGETAPASPFSARWAEQR